MIRTNSRCHGALASGLFFSLFCGVAHATSTVVSVWNQAALVEVRASRLGPPVVARALAVAHSCMYDAWTSYDPVAIGSVVATQRRPAAEHTLANKSTAVSFAAYQCLLNLFPAGASRLRSVMHNNGYNPDDTSLDPTTPQGLGNAAAAAVIQRRRFDGSNQYGDLAPGPYSDYSGYSPSNAPMPFCLPTTPGNCAINVSDPYSWQPLINDLGVTQRFVAPHWDRVTPFALSSAAQYDSRPEVAAGPNYTQGPANYNADIAQVLGASAGLTMQRKVIVEYWADGPASELPPGHWGLFAQHVSQRDANTIDEDVKMFFAMHNASHDAGIVAWHLKRKYNGVRPITAIRYLRQGQQIQAWGGPGKPIMAIDGGKWTPYNPGSNLTPAFPGYISGHATFSAASAAVLRAFTGSDNFGFSTVIPPNFGRVEPGVPAVPTPLTYATFTAAAAEAAASRLYAGIHFADDNNDGLTLGELVGKQAWAKAQFLFDGGLAASTSSFRASETSFLSWSHTVAPISNRLLLVGIATTDDSSSAASVTYAGIPLVRLGAKNGPADDNRVELWYLIAPPVGQFTVSVRLANNNDIVAGVLTFSGVHQTTPFGVLRSAANYTAAACVTLANESAPLVATMLAVNSDANRVQPGSGQTHSWNAVSDTTGPSGGYDIIGTGMVGPGSPSGSICQQLAIGKRWALLAVPLKPAQ